MPLNPSAAAPRACAKVHGRPLLLKKDSNKSFQTALERRGDTSGSKQPPGVTPLLPHRQLHKLGVGTARNAAQEGGSAGASGFLQLIPGRCFSNALCKAETLSFNSNTHDPQGTLSPRVGGTTNVRRDKFDGEVKPPLHERAEELHLNKIQPGGCSDTSQDPATRDEKPPDRTLIPPVCLFLLGPAPLPKDRV